MDIDDILASVDHGPGASLESTAIDHQLLTRFWVAERAVSEVLPWPTALMDRMMDRVRSQVSTFQYINLTSKQVLIRILDRINRRSRRIISRSINNINPPPQPKFKSPPLNSTNRPRQNPIYNPQSPPRKTSKTHKIQHALPSETLLHKPESLPITITIPISITVSVPTNSRRFSARYFDDWIFRPII